jgi:hypothetical protein
MDGSASQVIPEDTIYTNTELKKLSPVLLCEFYERILKVKKVETQEPETNQKGFQSVSRPNSV